MNKRIPLFVLIILALSLFGSSPTPVNSVAQNYTIDNETIYINDSNVYIAATPHTSTGGWVYLNFTSKRFEGSIDLVFGFDKSKGLPDKLELYNPHNEYTSQSYIIPNQYFTNKTFYNIKYNFTSKDSVYLYNGHVKLFNYYNNTWNLEWEHDFEKASIAKVTVYWTDIKHITWVNIASKVDIFKANYIYNNMNYWYFIKADILKDKEYYLRFWLDVIPSLNGGEYEYFIGVKPFNENFREAINNGHFYYLDPWWNNGWNYKTKITIDQTKVDADLTDFPVMIYLNSSRINWSHVQDDLDDIRFVDSTETTILKAELEKYVTNDNAWIWVKVPVVSGTVDTDFYIYYGNVVATSAWDAENVWEASAMMVQHMKDATTSTILDSTANNNDGIKKAANEPIETASGKIDSAQNFDTNDYITVSNANLRNFAAKTFLAWIIPAAYTGAYRILYDTNYATSPYGDIVGLMPLTNTIRIILYNTLGTFVISDVSSTPGSWTQVGYTWNGTKWWTIKNGVRTLVGAFSGTIACSAGDLHIGTTNTHDLGFNNPIDEFRIYNTVKSVEWVKADYNSGANTLLTYGVEEEYFPPYALTICYNEGINKLYINGTQRANNTTIYIDQNTNVNATNILKSNFIFIKYMLNSTGASLMPTYIFNMNAPHTLWVYATPNFFIYEEPTTFTFTHWLILLFIALVISLLAAIKFHIIATVSFILVLYMIINVTVFNEIILLAIIVWLLTIMFSIIAFMEI